VVTQHEVRMRWHDYFRIRPSIAIGRGNMILAGALHGRRAPTPDLTLSDLLTKSCEVPAIAGSRGPR
jgi:hypothetical protein